MIKASNSLHNSHNQNFWQLASIQIAGLGIPGIILGDQLANKYGPGSAICSLAVGDLVLWLIGITIISMVHRDRINAVENIKTYIGNLGGILVALMLMFTFLGWYVLQTNSSISELKFFFQSNTKIQKEITIRFGSALAVLSALLASGGIRVIKWLAVVSFPLLFIYQIYQLAISKNTPDFSGSWTISFDAVISAILLLLPGIINLPTFFRHSRSRADSYFALTIMALFTIFFQITSIWIKFSNFSQNSYGLGSSYTNNSPIISVVFYICLLLTLCNLLNIYLASACWEAIIPHFGGPKGYAIIGLVGTLAYTFIQISSPLLFFIDLANCYIGSLGIVLLISFLLRLIVRHRLRALEKFANGLAWLIGCVIATIFRVQNPDLGSMAILVGIGASSAFFLCVIFIEESIWAAKKIYLAAHIAKKTY